MQFITEKLFLYMLHHGVVEEKDSQIYRYGLQIAIEMNICIFTCVVVALFFKTIAESIFLTISFFLTRAYINGFHLKHFLTCYICSCTVIIGGSLFVNYFIIKSPLLLVFLLVELFLLQKLVRYTMSKKEKKEREYFSKCRKTVFCILYLFSCFVYVNGFYQMVEIIVYSVSVSAISVILKIHGYFAESIIKGIEKWKKDIMQFDFLFGCFI